MSVLFFHKQAEDFENMEFRSINGAFYITHALLRLIC